MYITMSETGNSHSKNSSPSLKGVDFSREKLFWLVLTKTGISEREILGNIRERPVLAARFAIMLALRKRGWSTPQIGRFLSRDHTTIVSSLRTARRWYNEKAAFRILVDALEQ
jgi:chromosomal replication initiation ATPase DnaA